MKTKLIFPPAWEVSQPYLSLPSLTAYLKQQNIHVSQVDLNIEIFDLLLSGEYIELAKQKIENQYDTYSEVEKKRINQFAEFLDYFIKNIEQIKNEYRSLTDQQNYLKCRGFLEHCLEWWSLAYAPEKIQLGSYESQYDPNVVQEIITSINHKEEHIFYQPYLDLLEELVSDVDLIGISLSGITQVIPSFILASMIKSHNPTIKICFGGSIVTRWKDRLKKLSVLFDYVDYLILYEGEEPLAKLIYYLEGKLDLQQVPNLVFRNEQGNIELTSIQKPIPMNNLPCPEFATKYFDKYFWPEPVLPMLLSRGCYWGKCTFCDHSYIYQNSYRERTQEEIKSHLKQMIEHYDVRYINFHDEAISPDLMEKLNETLETEKIEIYWSCDARLDKGLSREILKRSKANGLRVIFFGLESMNARVLKKIKKGIRKENVSRIIEDCSELKIWNHLFFFFGFPTESREEALETIEFLKKHDEYIGSSGVGIFRLGKYSPVAQNPNKYSIIISDEQKDLDLFLDFTYQSDTDNEEVIQLYDQVKDNFVGKFKELSGKIFRDHWITIDHKDIDLKNNFGLRPWIHFKIVKNEVKVIDLYQGKIFTFSKDTWHILNYIQQGFDKDEINFKLSEKFGVDVNLIQDSVAHFYQMLIKDDLVG